MGDNFHLRHPERSLRILKILTDDNMNSLKEKFDIDIREKMMKQFKIANTLAVPKITKVVVNMGVGAAVKNKEILEKMKTDLASITGQYPSVRKARVSVASFSLRRGMNVGLKVTLRGDKMYSFINKLFSVVLPRLRDFRGVSLKSFDQQGNYNLGMEDHTVFPEIDLAVSQPHGLEVTIVTNTKENEKAKYLLDLLGMPFEKINS